MDVIRAATALFDSPSRAFGVSLWDGTVLPPARDGGVRGQVALRDPRVLAALLPPASERRLAEAFVDGDLELEGDIAGLLEAAARWEGPRLRPSLAPAIVAILRRARWSDAVGELAARVRGRQHSVARDRDAVRHHYDLSDDFYRLFLDPALVYSCAYFAEGPESLETAQRAKLDLVCRKLALEPGDRLLDVGCGWGALLAYAVGRYDVDALGVTLSQNQLAEARRRLSRVDSGRNVSVVATDYRTLRPDAPFHKVASIGMMEHVGRARLDAYFAAIHRLLVPGGLFLNQAIADASPGNTLVSWAHRRRRGFIDRYIFPDTELIPVGEVVTAAERAGFEVRDLESLREHYASTAARWLARLEARFAEAERLVGRRRARAYRLYLAGTEVGFRLGQISVFQLLLAKRSETGRVVNVPRTRAAWYSHQPGRAAAEYAPWLGGGGI